MMALGITPPQAGQRATAVMEMHGRNCRCTCAAANPAEAFAAPILAISSA
jgi:hypothetical protein